MNKNKIQILNEEITYLYEENPKNKPYVLFIHGFGDEAKRALSFYRIKNRNYCLYSLDLPCCGNSSCHIKQPSLEFYGEIVIKFIEKMFLDKQIYIITHSMGTFPALYANKRIKNIKHIFACTPLNYIIDNPEIRYNKLIRYMLPKNAQDLFESQKALFSKSELESLTPNYLENTVTKVPKNFYQERINKFQNMIQQTMLNQEWANQNTKLLYKNIKNITIFYAEEDNFVLKSEIEKLIKENKLENVYFSQTGHAIFYKKTPEINKYIENFISKDQ